MTASKPEPDELTRLIGRRVGKVVADTARPNIPSKTLQAAMFVDTSESPTIFVNIPHYWAQIIHDGRGNSPRSPGLVLFFEDPKNDPRIQGGKKYPVHKKDIRSMWEFRDAYRRGLEENSRRRASGIKQMYMIVRRQVGPVAAKPFFSGMVGVGGVAERDPDVLAGMGAYLRALARHVESGKPADRIARMKLRG